MKEIRERNRTLENACSEKDKRLYNSVSFCTVTAKSSTVS